MALGHAFGHIMYSLGGTRRMVTETNIKKCFPELSEDEQQKLVYDSFVSNAKGYIETTIVWWRPVDRFVDTLQIHGKEHLEEAIARGKGIILLGGHFSILDFVTPFAGSVVDFNYMYRPQNNPLMDAVIERSRRRFTGRGFTKREIREMIDYVKQGNAVWYAHDQDLGMKHSIFAPFFGIQTATIKSTAWIARETGASVIQMSQFREQDGTYSLHFFPILENYPSDDELENATRVNAELEKAIRIHPEQYLWQHRRFKRRPEGEDPFYPRGKRKKRKVKNPHLKKSD